MKKLILLLSLVSISAYATDEFELKVRSLYQSQTKSEIDYSNISRKEVIKRALSAVDHRYVIRAQNYSSKVEENRCQNQAIWLRPFSMYDAVDKSVAGIPYKWGGYFIDLSQFDDDLNNGKLSGDVCTCRSNARNYCIVPESTGLDCSGFVSFAWKMPYHVTSTMDQITDPIAWDDLKPGDALNKAGSHIIMFDSYTKDKNYIIGIESSITCEGLCRRSFRRHSLKSSGYKPIRYKYIQD